MSNFFYGVIEGFYGQQWSWMQRQAYAQFLKDHHYGAYIYAPKGDRYLRSRWRELHPSEQWQQLIDLRACYRSASVKFGLGLSPFGLADGNAVDDKRLLENKVQHINQLQPDILCILFDDMRGDIPGIANLQVQAVLDIMAVSNAKHHIVCPSYYSFDPILEKVFGAMPADYFEVLGRGLPENCDVFWTGTKVVSGTYTETDAAKASQLLNRKPVLWDNYPVNDGKVICNHLHLRPFHNRPREISHWYKAHIVNPMNQAELSKLVLQSLTTLYRQSQPYDADVAFDRAMTLLDNPEMEKLLRRDLALFHDEGLTVISDVQRKQLLAEYGEIKSVFADEVVRWLAGEFKFDPACLTE